MNSSTITVKMSTSRISLTSGVSNGNSSGNDTGLIGNDDDIPWQRVVLGVFQYSIVLVTVCGNALVLVAVARVKQLQTVFNVYIVNLAITDILVGLIAMNFFAAYNIFQKWPFPEILCDLWIFGDFGMTFASIFTMLAISLDRYWSVHWPNVYRIHNNKRKAVIATAMIWCSMLLLWMPAFVVDRINNSKSGECFYDPTKNKIFVIIVATIGYHGSTVVMVFCYVKVFLAVRQRNKVQSLSTSLPSVQTSMVVVRASPDLKNALKNPRPPNKNNCGDDNNKLEQRLAQLSSCSHHRLSPFTATGPHGATNKCYHSNAEWPVPMSSAENVIARERPDMESTVCHDSITQTLGQSGFTSVDMARPRAANAGYRHTIELDQRSAGNGTISNDAAACTADTTKGHNRSVRGCRENLTKEESSAKSSTQISASVSFVEELSSFDTSPSPTCDIAPPTVLQSDEAEAASRRLTETAAGRKPRNDSRGNENNSATPAVSSAALHTHPLCHSVREERSGDGQRNQTHNAAASSQAESAAPSTSTFIAPSRANRSLQWERKIFVTLTYIMAGYVVCWLPFHLSFDLMAFHRTLVPEWFYAFTYWLAYCNSAINPFLYNFSNSDFHQAFVKLIGWKKRRRLPS